VARLGPLAQSRLRPDWPDEAETSDETGMPVTVPMLEPMPVPMLEPVPVPMLEPVPVPMPVARRDREKRSAPRAGSVPA
jgi:hypothetical protein